MLNPPPCPTASSSKRQPFQRKSLISVGRVVRMLAFFLSLFAGLGFAAASKNADAPSIPKQDTVDTQSDGPITPDDVSPADDAGNGNGKDNGKGNDKDKDNGKNEPDVVVDEPVVSVPDDVPTTEDPAPVAPIDDSSNTTTGTNAPDGSVDEPVVSVPDDRPTIEDPAPVAPDVTVDDPVVSAPDDVPTAEDTAPVAPVAPTGNSTDNDNTTDAADLGDSFQGTAISGRVKTFELQDDTIESVTIVTGPEYGNVTVNPDNTLAVVLTNTTETSNISFQVEATHTDGSVTTHEVNLDVTEGPLTSGWAIGDTHYMLETDENDDVVVEHGENHQKVYVSGDEDALTLNDIAILEGLPVDKITQKFLVENTEYGRTEDTALAEDAGMRLWKGLTGADNEPSSHWLLMERGYEYDIMGGAIENGTTGESELNPIYIGAYGEGDVPLVNSNPVITSEGIENVVIQGLHFTKGFTSLTSENLLIDDSIFSGREVNLQNADGFTFHNSAIYDVADHAARDDTWSPMGDRVSGIFISKSTGLLFEGSLFDHNGWEEGYDYYGDGNYGQPPTMFSHNVYIQRDNDDVTFKDNIVMQGASFGAQLRSGGFIEDNVFIDNNAGVNFLNGRNKQTDEFEGNYTLFTDNVVTSGAHKEVDEGQGALTLGVSAVTQLAALVDNIVAHLADPNNPDELAEKPTTHDAVQHGDNTEIFYDDTITYNWAGEEKYDTKIVSNSENVDGLDTNILDQTTIQLFTAQLLGKETATIQDLADFLRDQANGQLDDVVDADLIITFFQTGFGITPDLRGEADVLRFVPNELGEGMRWDNRLNWSTEDLPGTQDGDSVDLAGNWVQYGGTTTLEDLDFGDGGQLGITHGYLEIEDHIAVGEAGAVLNIDSAGQFFTAGYTDQDLLTLNVSGGRFVNTDLYTGHTDLNISDNAQAILATDGADYVVNDKSSISITGGDAKVGFDGDQGDTAVLLMSEGAELAFTAQGGDIGEIKEFYSGHYDGEAPDVQSGVNLGEADLILDLTEIAGGAATTATLINVDEIIGDFANISVTGLGYNQDAEIVIDYDNDTVVLSLGAAGQGSGDAVMTTTGNELNAQDNADLWAALTNGHGVYSNDLPEDIPSEEDEYDFEL